MTPTIESETAETYRALNVAESHAGLLERRLDQLDARLDGLLATLESDLTFPSAMSVGTTERTGDGIGKERPATEEELAVLLAEMTSLREEAALAERAVSLDVTDEENQEQEEDSKQESTRLDQGEEGGAEEDRLLDAMQSYRARPEAERQEEKKQQDALLDMMDA